MKSPRTRSEKALLLPLIFALVCAAATALSAPDSSAATAKAQPKTFASPEEAVKALVDAMKTGDKAELSAIFGPGSESLISSGDDVEDKAGRERFLKNYEEKNSLEKKGDDEVHPPGGEGRLAVPDPHPEERFGLVLRHEGRQGRDPESPDRPERTEHHRRPRGLRRRAAGIRRKGLGR